jgi:Tfp pilus assembly protein PilX
VIRLHEATRRRLRRAEDDGMVLVYTLIVTMLVLGAVTSLLVTVTSALAPTRQTQDDSAAYAAAQAGIQDAIAYLNGTAACHPYSSGCATPANPTNTRGGSDALAGSGESFTWSLRGQVSAGTSNYLRVSSTGRAGHSAKQLVADIQPVKDVFDYAYYSTYETLGSDELNAYYPQRQIKLDDSATCGKITVGTVSCSATSPATVSWNGAGASTAAYPDSVCNRVWYTSTALNGSADPTGRAGKEQLLAITSPGADWSETGTLGAKTLTRYAPCQVAFTRGMTFNGPAYTADAPLISNQLPDTAHPGCADPARTATGPVFQQGLYTAWSSTNTPAAPAGQPYRADLSPVCGTPSGAVRSQPNPLTFKTTFDPSPPTSACIYYGPTRIRLTGSTATVTSPATDAAHQTSTDASCYATRNALGQFTISTANRVIWVRNLTGADATKYTGQRAGTTAGPANTVFYLTAGSPATAADPASAVPANWTQAGANAQTWAVYTPSSNCWSVSRNPTTPNGPKPWEEQTFQCDWWNQMGNKNYVPPTAPNDGYTAYQTAVGADLARTTPVTIAGNAGNTVSYTLNGGTAQTKTIDCSTAASTTFVPSTATADQLVCLLQHELRPANTGQNEANWANPSYTNYTHQYVVSSYAQNTSVQRNVTVGSTPSIDMGGDSLFNVTSQAGKPSTEDVTTTTTTFNVASQVYGCYVYGLVGGLLGSPSGKMDISGNSCTALIPTGKWAWGDGYYPNQSSAQFQVTVTQKSYSNFQQGSQAAAYFPDMSDVTQYHAAASQLGDVYLEGSYASSLSVLADDDAVVTGNLTASNGAGMDVDTLHDIRLYHPVSCVTAPDSSTTPGYCPDDITGLYAGLPTSDAAHPANKYRASGPTITRIDAALVAQGSASSNGSLLTDNFNRAINASTQTLTVNGGVYQRHRGALGTQWEVPTSGASSRATSGYTLAINYTRYTGLPYVPTFDGGNPGHYWNLVSVSSRPTAGLAP